MDIVEMLRDPALDHDCLHRMRAANEIERLRAAISWALGEAPDHNGKWFEPDDDEPRRPDGQPVARYWWRGNLRRLTTPNAKLRGATDELK